ncbi:MAG TPA: vitamin K epoxide reductase family protein [Opitutaceae bacterium]|nr:vitamin K epoxide reductase family protein [Opitutaceae bacterium]
MTTSLKTWYSSLICALGFALALYLGLLKLYALPCFGGHGCDSVIHSQYGSVLRLPVGFVGALIWAGAILNSDRTKRRALLFLLALGSLAFMGIQFFILRSFCLYCTAHAITCWLAFVASKEAPFRASVLLGAALALGGFFLARTTAQNRAAHFTPPAATAVASLPLTRQPSGVAWLAPIDARSPALVVSLNCAACLDLLEELTKYNFADVHAGPVIYFKVTDENRELTTNFVAAVLAQPTSKSNAKREAFLAATALLLSIKDQALSSPQIAATQLAAFMPAAASQRDAAAELLATQNEVLSEQHLSDTTPLLVPNVGKPRAIFKVDELFPE